MRYASARMDEADRREIYMAYVAEHLRALLGSGASYVDLVGGGREIDAEAVKASVIERGGLEVEA